MEVIKPKNISKFIMILPLVGIFFTVVLITIITTYTIKENFEREKQQIIQNFKENLKHTTKKRVDLAYNVIDALYHSYKSKKDAYTKTIKIMQQVLDKMRWDKKGYIFVFDYYGNTLYHPNKYYMTINRWNFERNGVKVIRLLIQEALKHPKGTYVKYLAYNPDGSPLEKISFVKLYKPLNIVIGNGVYLDYLDKKLLKKQTEKENLLHLLIKKIIFVSVIILFIMSLIMLYFSHKLQRLFKKYDLEINKEKENLFRKANFDTLTSLHNRSHFMLELSENIAFAKKENKKLFVLFLDLDHFKEINDSLGHQVGDKVLQIIANRLKNILSETDIVGRFGGDEFLILLNDINSSNITTILEKILNTIKEPIELDKNRYYLSVSIGVSVFPDDDKSGENLIKYADIAMYKSKKEGKDRFSFYQSSMSENANNKVIMKNALHYALENNEFEVYFQPLLDKNSLIGMEALIRWNHPIKGLIFPDEFIPLAIDIGLINEIDLWVIENSMKQYKIWQKKGFNAGILSCNITMNQLEKNDFSLQLKKLLEKYNFNPKLLNLEITEDSVMKHPQKSINMLLKIKNLGIEISVDDFGTGYSSLSYLKKLPISKLKIDKSFIMDIPQDKDDMSITKTIINLAKNMNLQVVAEGIENQIQEEFVLNNGCDYLQGYYYSKPIDAKQFEEKFLKDNNGSK